MRKPYQSKICQRILNSNLRVHLNPNFRESGLHTYKKTVLVWVQVGPLFQCISSKNTNKRVGGFKQRPTSSQFVVVSCVRLSTYTINFSESYREFERGCWSLSFQCIQGISNVVGLTLVFLWGWLGWDWTIERLCITFHIW